VFVQCSVSYLGYLDTGSLGRFQWTLAGLAVQQSSGWQSEAGMIPNEPVLAEHISGTAVKAAPPDTHRQGMYTEGGTHLRHPAPVRD
jgi:hypothetical protein